MQDSSLAVSELWYVAAQRIHSGCNCAITSEPQSRSPRNVNFGPISPAESGATGGNECLQIAMDLWKATCMHAARSALIILSAIGTAVKRHQRSITVCMHVLCKYCNVFYGDLVNACEARHPKQSLQWLLVSPSLKCLQA